MSTIASPRDSSVPGRQRLPLISTPSSSARPSFDNPRNDGAANRTPTNASAAPPRRNRAALREYYNLKKEEQKIDDSSSEAGGASDNGYGYSDVQESEMDRDGFDGEAYVRAALESQNLEELLRTYSRVLSDIRALDAEKKALVYDNYSKLIAATETIRKMRANMDPLNPMASTLDPAIAQIYERANSVKDELRSSMNEEQTGSASVDEGEQQDVARKAKATMTARRVLDTPHRIRTLMAQDKTEEAKREWQATSRILERWKNAGQGGEDVQDCIDDGDAALRGEPANEKSWANVKDQPCTEPIALPA